MSCIAVLKQKVKDIQECIARKKLDLSMDNSQNANQSRVALSVSAGPRDQDEASRGPVDVHSPTIITVSKRTSVIRRNIRAQNHEAHPVDPSGN